MEERELTPGERFLRDRANETEHERRARISRILATIEPLPDPQPKPVTANDLIAIGILFGIGR